MNNGVPPTKCRATNQMIVAIEQVVPLGVEVLKLGCKMYKSRHGQAFRVCLPGVPYFYECRNLQVGPGIH